ncbi:MAG: hypothetical protein KZQ58_03345 [gamma proteobacterium symbiont of Bathyaustriella thionipta]|nr:hypothetical protein [gamma proteobacterium symbiont of Bathyaustriella thionipta]
MAHYEERLERDLKHLRAGVDALASSVVDAVKDSVHALLSGNEKLAGSVILADGPINRSMRALDAECHAFIAVHLPSAGHLRLVSAIIRINILLERIGDYAVTISRELLQLGKRPQGAIADGIQALTDESVRVLEQAIEAFKQNDEAAAKQTMKLAKQVRFSMQTVMDELVREQDEHHITDLFALFVVVHHLVRVADQSKNLCEDTVFAISGETKAKKIYRVLFLDEDNSCLSQMAQAIARKSYSYGGQFFSAGRAPAAALHPHLEGFLEQHGIDLLGMSPRALDAISDDIQDFHVVISLQGHARSYLSHLPFHTTLLDWDIGGLPAEQDDEQSRQRFEEIYRDLALNIQNLMLLLRGEEQS